MLRVYLIYNKNTDLINSEYNNIISASLFLTSYNIFTNLTVLACSMAVFTNILKLVYMILQVLVST